VSVERPPIREAASATRLARGPDADEFLNACQVARLRGCGDATVGRAIKRGDLRATRVGDEWRIRRADADAWSPKPHGGQPNADADTRRQEAWRLHREEGLTRARIARRLAVSSVTVAKYGIPRERQPVEERECAYRHCHMRFRPRRDADRFCPDSDHGYREREALRCDRIDAAVRQLGGVRVIDAAAAVGRSRRTLDTMISAGLVQTRLERIAGLPLRIVIDDVERVVRLAEDRVQARNDNLRAVAKRLTVARIESFRQVEERVMRELDLVRVSGRAGVARLLVVSETAAWKYIAKGLLPSLVLEANGCRRVLAPRSDVLALREELKAAWRRGEHRPPTHLYSREAMPEHTSEAVVVYGSTCVQRWKGRDARPPDGIPAAKRKWVKAHRKTGASMRDIASMVGISVGSVANILAEDD
jgi:excisionase family DNA binding protein